MSRLFIGLLLLIAQISYATTYEVGPGRTYTSISAVPWESIRAGDTVLIYYRTNSYNEKWVICRQGTATAPITVHGVPGPNGELPVINGIGATTRTTLNYWGQDRGILKIGGANVPADTMPRYITIENLDIQSGRPPYTFTASDRATFSYQKNAASIWIEKGENITIRNCRIHDSGNGLFVSSGDLASTNILVESCYIFDNGNVGSGTEHNVYTEALGITYQYNRFGPLRASCAGNNLKDRSAGLVVRYNWIEGGSRELDLVDATDSAIVLNSPLYRKTYVYGNAIIEPAGDGNKQILQYGGDSGNTTLYRKGMLYFYNNTVYSKRTDNSTLFKLPTNDEHCDARNNIFQGASTLALVDSAGVLNLTHNWIRSGYVSSFSGVSGTIASDNMITGSAPGFLDQTNDDYHLSGNSPCRNVAGVLNPDVLPMYDVVREYVKHQSSQARWNDGALDLGAFEFSSAPEPAVTTQPLSRTNVAGTTATFSVSVSGNFPLSFQWMKGPDDLVDGGNVFGSTTPTLTLTNVATADAADYSARVTNAFGATTSAVATLTVLTKPAIVSQPQNTAQLVGTDATFNVGAAGGNLVYQWKRGTTNLIDGARIVGAKSDTLTVLSVATSDVATNYSVVITNLAGSVTSSRAALTVLVSPYITKQPTNQSVIFNSNAVFRVTAAGTAPLAYQWFKNGGALVNGGNITGSTSTNLTVSSATTNDAGTYSVVVSSPYGTVTSSDALLTVIPAVSITSPAEAASFTNSNITVIGKASDLGSSISQVLYQLNGGVFQPAVGTTNWTAAVQMQPGTNVFAAKSVNAEGRESALVTRHYFYAISATLTLITNGIGSVTGATNGQHLWVGRNYSLTATAGAGQILSNWSGTITSSNNPFTFMMQTGMVVMANFVPNPFLTRTGTYNGLFYETAAVNHDRSGFFKFTLASSGTYSGSVYLGGVSRSISGKFFAGGDSHLVITSAPPLTIDFNLDVYGTSGEVSGQVAGTNWLAPLLGDRAAFVAPVASNYTLTFVGTSDGSTSPGGDGFGNFTVATNGLITLTGRVSDDSALAPVAAFLSQNGDWPLYVPLYANKGSLLGWVTNDGMSFQGNVSWIKTGASGTNYSAGFTNELLAISSTISKLTTTNRALSLTNGLASLTDGSLPFGISNHVVLNTNNTITVLAGQTNGLTLSLNVTNGQFTGSFLIPSSTARATIKGVLLQQQNVARGYFLSPLTGRFMLQPE